MSRVPDLHVPPPLPSGPRLAFAETAADAEIVLAAWSDRQIDAVVALEPEAAWTLRAAGRAYLSLEDGYDPRALCALADPIVARQQTWANQVDEWLHARVPAFAEDDFRPARLYLYWLKLLFDSLAIRVYPMLWAFDAWKPSSIWHPCPAAADAQFEWDLMFRNSLYPVTLRSVADKLGIPAELSEVEFTTAAPAAALSDVPHWAKRSRLIDWAGRGREAARTLLRPRWRRPAVDDEAVLVLSDAYDLRPVRDAAARARRPILPWNDVVSRARAADNTAADGADGMNNAPWADAAASCGLLDPALVEGCDLRAVAQARVRFWWETLIPAQWRAYQAVRRDPQLRRVRAVAVPGLGDHIERAAFAALRSIGARGCIYQHGGFVGACEAPAWDCNDLWLADQELTYGDGTTRYFSRRAERYPDGRALPVSVGSSRLDAWRRTGRRRARPTARPHVLLIPNLIPRNNRYFDAGTTPDVLESELQIALVEAARDFPHCRFTFKAFPFPGQTAVPAVVLARGRESNCRVAVRSMRRLIARADFVVLSFASTALLEALTTDRQILVLVDPRFVLMHADALAALKRRAHVAENPAAFIATYRRLLAEGDFGRVPAPDDTFLREYGTYLDDGRSAVRALNAIWPPAVPAADRSKTCLARA